VFALLLFDVQRSGNIAAMSPDVLVLLGISAAGAVGGKLVHSYRRRLSYPNWAWLTRHNWLPENKDVRKGTERAKWSELLLDPDTKEFDPYSFQMIVFTAVVAVALLSGGVGGLETFKIPGEMLALLGISQVVFIGGRAIDKTGYDELDKQLDEVQANEASYAQAVAKRKIAEAADPARGQAVKDAETAEEGAKTKLETSVKQTAEMFWGIYREQVGKKPDELVEAIAHGRLV
jgi:hypothetical protein